MSWPEARATACASLHPNAAVSHAPLSHAWRRRPVVDALQAPRGVRCPVAVTATAEWGALARVGTPGQLMHDLGLTPAACSTGDHRRPGASPTTGNAPARRLRSPQDARRLLESGGGREREPVE